MPILPKIATLVAIAALITSVTICHSALTFAQSATSSAQITPIERAKNDYTFQFTKFRDAQEEYQAAKSTYLSFKTAVAKTDAYTKTGTYLKESAQLYITLILLAKEYGNTFAWGKSGAEKDRIAKTLDAEVQYLNTFKQKVALARTLEELPPLATELKDHVKQELEPKLNKTIVVYEIVETETLLEEFNSISRLLDRLVIIKLRAGETKAILANWASEIRNIREKTSAKLTEAREVLAETQEEKADERKKDEIVDLAEVARGQLKRSKPLFEELIRIL